jgi:NAD(P)-dependent dehydrogenase (short-subunit alcohol dehydrogenase family)
MRALITGCSTGIGHATAIELTKRGYEVVATARRPDSLDDLDVAQKLALDVDDDASVARAVKEAGEVDVLVNNAGFGIHGPVETVPLEEVRRVFETNVFGAVRMMQAVLPQMRQRVGGAIVNVSSISGRVSSPLGGFYSASKYALEAITEALHYEVGTRFGIRIVLIEPGGFETSFDTNRRIAGCDAPPYDELDRIWSQAQDKLRQGTPPGPEAVAQTIADALEADPPKLRWPVGEDASMVLDVRGSTSDEEFEATMRSYLGLEW